MRVREVGREKLKKTFVTICTVSVAGLGSVFLGSPSSADTLEDLKSKDTQIQQDREDIKTNLYEAEAEMAGRLIELEKINKEIERAAEALEENKATMKKNEQDVSATQKYIDELEEEIAALEALIEQRFDIL